MLFFENHVIYGLKNLFIVCGTENEVYLPVGAIGIRFNMSIARHAIQTFLRLFYCRYHQLPFPIYSFSILLVIPNFHWSFYCPHLFSFLFIYMDHWSHMGSFTRKYIPLTLYVLLNLFLIHKLFSPFNWHCIVRKTLSKFLLSYSLVLLSSRL